MDQLDTDFTETLPKTGLGDFKTTLKKNIDDIKPRDQYVVLVAGKMTQLLLCTVFFKNTFYKYIEADCANISRRNQSLGFGRNIILCTKIWSG